MKNALIVSGSGGQGVMSIGIMLAMTAVASGKYATYLPEYGPEQRGGSAKCTVITDDSEIISPLVKKSDMFIAMNEQAYKKFSGQVKEGGFLIYNSSRVTSEITRDDIKAIGVPADEIATELGNIKAANIVMIGALIKASGIVSEEDFISHLAEKFKGKKPEILELNKSALKKGMNTVKN